jgi:hypothetical protein
MGVLSPQFGSLLPSQAQQLLTNNYLQFNTAGANDFAQQYLPEVYEAEVERYGNRTISGFLRMVGAEMPMTSDQVIWSEQNRLHIAYDNVAVNAAGDFTIPAAAVNVVYQNMTIVVMDPANPSGTVKAIVTDSTTNAGYAGAGGTSFTAVAYTQAQPIVTGKQRLQQRQG